jgi:hypothetical protein
MSLQVDAVSVLRELVELKAIKRKIELRTATDDERERYKFSKAKAWNDAEAILHDSPLPTVDAPKPRGTYEPLTEEQIERVRSVYKRHFSDGERLDTVCDMAVNCLLYGQEIDRLRSLPSDTDNALRSARLLVERADQTFDKLQAEVSRLTDLINSPEIENFLEGTRLEAAHQVERWGAAHDRDKSAENWFWLVGYLAGKALRAAITGDRTKALHHCISSAAALLNWHRAIAADTTGCGAGQDADIKPVERAA